MRLSSSILAVLAGLTAAACSGNPAASADHGGLDDCDITLNGIRFTKSLNGASTLVKDSAGVVLFDAKPGADFFCDPAPDTLPNTTSAVLLTEVDNTKPFTFSVRVNAGFVPDGTYSAAVLFVYVDNTHWQKLCFEQDERGNHRVVTVRTDGTSDDNNHEAFNDAGHVYFKISSDTHKIGSYYSRDSRTWQMARLYRNDYGDRIYLGISSQAPQVEECVSTFEDLSLTDRSIENFRLGE